MPDLSHFWQRFVLASALVFGLALGVGATVFGYSNTATVNLGWSVLHLNGVPLWTVAIVPVALILVVGTLYHWWNSLHHFTEHMRHRRRVHELEAEVTTLRKHLDELLQMPGQSARPIVDAEPVPALPEPAAAAVNGSEPAANGDVKVVAKAESNGAAEPESETAVPSEA